ncbi:MAG: hypothetical protein M0P70_05480 [Desulfobulbaceae bacterium]|nr:hypothetical protein [Desulfobulbaceae bacterium]
MPTAPCTLAFLPEAQAASLSVSPTGSFDAQGVSSITYDVFLNVAPTDGSLTFISWDFNMQYDTGELGNPVATNVLAGSLLLPVPGDPGTLNDSFFSLFPTTDVHFPPGAAYQLASVTFDILNPVQAFDGIADFRVVSEVGDPVAGFTTAQGEILQLDGADGADVGAPVPLPGAVWLLGYGLLSLAGLRKKIKS